MGIGHAPRYVLDASPEHALDGYLEEGASAYLRVPESQTKCAVQVHLCPKARSSRFVSICTWW